ncbi:MAG: glycosyltransferase [Planctomycetota bacterium]
MNIAQANFHLLWGGQAEVALALSRELAQRGHRLFVLAPPGSELAMRAKDAGLNVFTGCRFRKGFRPLSFFRDVARLRAFLRENDIQIYHCHGSQDHWTGAVAATSRTKIVRTRHNIYPIKNHLFNRWLFRGKTAQVITIFKEQERYFTADRLLKPEQLVTLHSPLPREFVEAQNVCRIARQELQIEATTPLVGFVANFHPDKAPLDFIAAAEKIAAILPTARFCMAGHGPLEKAMREAIKKAGLDERLHLLGFRKDILEVIASFDLLLLTSVAREASSTVIKQAAALNVPVIATDVGGTREIIEDGRTGILVKAGDIEALAAAAQALLTDRPRAATMSRLGKEKVLREFTARTIAARTEELYLRLLNKV